MSRKSPAFATVVHTEFRFTSLQTSQEDQSNAKLPSHESDTANSSTSAHSGFASHYERMAYYSDG